MTFGRLTVVGLAGYTKTNGRKKLQWLCECECGNTITAVGANLVSVNTTSCGCAHKEMLAKRNTTHGESKGGQSPEYRILAGIIKRCTNKKDRNYPRYGGRGISVHPAFSDHGGCIAFIAEVGRRPTKQHSIDRIDNNGNYEPGNIKWSNSTQQALNRRNNRLVTYNGETLACSQWSARLGGNSGLVHHRIYRGWTPEQAVSTPVGGKRKKEV